MPGIDVDRPEEVRPDFEGFVRALRDEAHWIEVIKAPPNDAQGQASHDASALLRLADRAERVGISQGYLAGIVL